jgi:hypothetical protein
LSVWMERSSWPYFKTRVKVCVMTSIFCGIFVTGVLVVYSLYCLGLLTFARNKLNKEG